MARRYPYQNSRPYPFGEDYHVFYKDYCILKGLRIPGELLDAILSARITSGLKREVEGKRKAFKTEDVTEVGVVSIKLG